jgi:hypothetical protein
VLIEGSRLKSDYMEGLSRIKVQSEQATNLIPRDCVLIRIAKIASLPYIGLSARAWLNSCWTSYRIWQVETDIVEKRLPWKVPFSLLILYNIKAIYKLYVWFLAAGICARSFAVAQDYIF